MNAAQLYAAALKQVPGLETDLQEAKYGRLLEWLQQNIHRHGRRYSPSELMKRATGETPTATYFMDYLRGKYGL